MALSLDGSFPGANATASSVTTGTLTTTTGSGVIVAATLTNGGPVTSVTAAGLTFVEKLRNKVNTTGSANQFTQVFTAPYTVNFSGTITSNNTASGFSTTTVFGIGGADTSNPFDTDASLAGTSTSGNPGAINTSNANDFIFFNVATSGTVTAIGSGWLTISVANFQAVGYQIVAATQAALAGPGSYTGGGNPAGGSLDAIVQASGGGGATASYGNMAMMGVGHHRGLGWAPLLDRRSRVFRRPPRLWTPSREIILPLKRAA